MILEPGQRFGSYQLLAPLSRGGMGEVWRALKIGSGGTSWSRQVALKVILPGYADLQVFSDLFASEARIAAGLSHANIVPVSDFGREGNVLFLEQELVDGKDLAWLLQRAPGGFPLPLAMYMVAEVLKAVAHAHSHTLPDGRPQSVIDRDIKPANILVSREGSVKLTDFGIARIASGSGQSMTQVRGTAGYLAPEILAGQPPSPRSDLFAVGLIFWELLTGTQLFSGDNDAVRMFKAYQCEVPPLLEAGVLAPSPVESIVRRLLARHPAERYQSADEVLVDLLDAPGGRSATSIDLKVHLASLGLRPSLPAIDALPGPPARRATETMAGRPPRRRRRMWLTLAVLGGVAAVGVGLARRQPHPPPPPPAPALIALAVPVPVALPAAPTILPVPVAAAWSPPDAGVPDAPPPPRARPPRRKPVKSGNDGLIAPDEEQ